MILAILRNGKLRAIHFYFAKIKMTFFVPEDCTLEFEDVKCRSVIVTKYGMIPWLCSTRQTRHGDVRKIQVRRTSGTVLMSPRIHALLHFVDGRIVSIDNIISIETLDHPVL